MSYQIYNHPKTLAASTSLLALPGAKLYFYLTTTTTPTDTYTTSALSVAHTNPVVADAAGVFPTIYLNPTIVYKVTYATAADVLVYTVDPVNDQILSAAVIGGLLYPRTAAEISAGVTPVNYAYEPGDVRRYGAVGDGVTNDTSAIQSAINVGKTVFFYGGTFLANNLTQNTFLQQFRSFGFTRIQKNANGTLLTCSADNVTIQGIDFYANSFTGDNVVMNGENPSLLECGSWGCDGRAVLATGNHVQIIGTNNIYQTTDVSATGFEIEIGTSGTARLYHRIMGYKSSTVTGGIKFIDCGGQIVEGSQFGKLHAASGTSPAGTNGGTYVGNRIVGNITVDLSNSSFSANVISTGLAIAFAGGTSGHSFDRSNVIGSGTTITDSSTLSVVEDARIVPYQTYTCTWTAASVNPAIVNGSITAYYSKKGREVTVNIIVVMGSSTTFGTGAWFFSLPAIPNTSVNCLGSAQVFDSGTNFRTGVTKSATDGTARMQAIIDSDSAVIDSGRPMAWATGDQLIMSCTYFTN